MSGVISAEPDASGNSCYNIDVDRSHLPNPIALRIFTFPNSAVYTIRGEEISGSNITVRRLPLQGFRVTAIGEVVNVSGSSLITNKATRKKVIAEKSYPYPSGPWFDFAVSSINGVVTK